MNINTTLFNQIKEDLYNYDCFPKEIEQFLTHKVPFLERQRSAIEIIKGVMTVHGKQELFNYLAELARIEHGIRELEPWVRDHVVHALLSFILGIYLNKAFIQPTFGSAVNKLQWKLAGLFHDVGYPVQMAKDLLSPLAFTINEIKRRLGVHAPDVGFIVIPQGFGNLIGGLNSYKLIQDRLDDWELQIDVKEEYSRMIHSGQICHGIISALAVLYVINLMYHKYNPKRENSDIYTGHGSINWNYKYFMEDIVSACSAIYIHNLPKRCFTSSRIDGHKAPVAFLLKLADCLQEWERPSADNSQGYPATLFNIGADNGQLIYTANIADSGKSKIQEDVLSCLANPNIQIK